MNEQSTVEALLFAGGVGSRMGVGTRPKQFLEMGGRPILDYTIEHFASHQEVGRVVVVCLEGWIGYLESVLAKRRYSVPIDVIPGGSTGQESIFLGLRHLHELDPDDEEAIVLVHDGVRPLVDASSITACIASVRVRGCTATVTPAIETIVVKGECGEVAKVIPRQEVQLARAPQGFFREQLYAAHLRAQSDGLGDFIDSMSMMTHYGYRIYTVEGPVENIKVTTPMDYFAFKAYMEARDQSVLWDASGEGHRDDGEPLHA